MPTVLVEKLAAKDITEIVNVLKKAAKDGCVQSQTLLLARLWPVPKGRLVRFPLPPTKTMDDVGMAPEGLLKAVADGILTIGESTE